MRELELLLQCGRGGTTGIVSIMNAAAAVTSVLQCMLKSRGAVIRTVAKFPRCPLFDMVEKKKSSLLFKTDFMLCKLHPVSWKKSGHKVNKV